MTKKAGRLTRLSSPRKRGPRSHLHHWGSDGFIHALALLLALLAVSCHRPPPANPHYLLGQPYQAGDAWFYPRESYEMQETGLAMVYPSGHADLTSDGEAFDQTALAASHQTLQLPAIARLTNLENGLQVLVRINDRGPATPHRLIELTRRTAMLLGLPTDGVARVRLQVLPVESHAAVDAVPGAPKLELATAPRGAVQQTALPPPGSAAPVNADAAPAPWQSPAETVATTDLRLPETVTQASPDPGNLFVRLGTFQTFEYADIQRARVAGLGARIVSTREGRVQTHRVIVGPFTSVQQADVVLDQVLRAGVTDARIVVE
jgi:rare lipoprotein A